jgi:hypothetical protein
MQLQVSFAENNACSESFILGFLCDMVLTCVPRLFQLALLSEPSCSEGMPVQTHFGKAQL